MPAKRAAEEAQGASRISEEREGPDPRDVDRVLGEMVALSGRWALYRRFVSNRLSVSRRKSIMVCGELPDGFRRCIQDEGSDRNDAGEKMGTDSLPDLGSLATVDTSDGQRAIENMLRRYYEPMEEWYLRTSIEKVWYLLLPVTFSGPPSLTGVLPRTNTQAHKLDIPDLSSRPYISSMVDDTFYLLKLVLSRLLSAGALSTHADMRQSLTLIIERDYVGVLQKKMEAVYVGGSTGISLVKHKDAEKEKREKELSTSYSVSGFGLSATLEPGAYDEMRTQVLLNDLDISAHYMERLIEDMTSSNAVGQSFLDNEYEAVRLELTKFTDLSTRMRNIVKVRTFARLSSFGYLLNVLKPRSRPALTSSSTN
jgi:hypothetical protein